MATPEPQDTRKAEPQIRGTDHGVPQIHDIVCIGFGATGVALAVAFHEKNPNLKIQFLDQQSRRSWKPFAHLAGERMRTTFLDDLITTRNPCSKFTYINYLHDVGQLIDFTNLADMHPSRHQYSQYLTWCADQFRDQVVYGKRVLRVEPVRSVTGLIAYWKIVTRDVVSNKVKSVVAKRVISAVGKQARIPLALSSIQPSGKLIHACDCSKVLEELLSSSQSTRNIALVGDGQQAAEIFLKLHTELSSHRITWFTRDPVLQSKSDTAFETRMLQEPNLSHSLPDVPAELRRRYLFNQGTSQHASSIDADIVKKLYDLQYNLHIAYPDENTWPYKIRPYVEVNGVERNPGGQISLSLLDLRTKQISSDDTSSFDLVIAATGYERTEYRRILKDVESLSESGSLNVDRDYKVDLVKRSLSPGVGIWLLGSLENPEDDDSLMFLTLQTRSFRLAASVLTEAEKESDLTERGSRL